MLNYSKTNTDSCLKETGRQTGKRDTQIDRRKKVTQTNRKTETAMSSPTDKAIGIQRLLQGSATSACRGAIHSTATLEDTAIQSRRKEISVSSN